MRIVIVGASGNVGTALLRQLAGGEDEVVGVSRRIPSPTAPYDGALWRSVDISAATATDQLARVFEGADAVVNLAWLFQPTRDAAQLERVGVGGLLSVARAVTQAGVPHLLHMSSVGAYSPARPGTRVDESWPTDGVPTSVYSVHKAAAERLLDDIEAEHPDLLVTRFRPGLILQASAGSALLRYGLPGWMPAAIVRLLPVLPIDGRIALPVVHADDVARAVLAAARRRIGGAFNLSAEPRIGRAGLAKALGALPVPLPAPVLHAVVDLTFRAHLQRLDVGWVDLAYSVPLLDTARARQELDWSPQVDAQTALEEAVAGMRSIDSTASPVLRRRTVRGELSDLLRMGPIAKRPVP
jgi:nucleoside-diphosphate-sugar epimerase